MKTILALLLLCGLTGCKPAQSGKPAQSTTKSVARAHLGISTAGGVLPVRVPQKTDDSPSCKCDPEALDFAVLDRLRTINFPDYNSLTVDNDNNSKSDLDREQKAIYQVHAWAGKLKDRCIRKKFLGWMDYYQDSLNEAYAELKTKAKAQEQDTYEGETDRLEAEAKRCERKGMVPKPPSGSTP